MGIVGDVLGDGVALAEGTAHEVGQALSLGARFAPLAGSASNLAGFAANNLGATLVTLAGGSGCDRGVTGRTINNFLDMPFGLGQTAVTRGAGLAGPEASLFASFAIGAYQQATDTNCGNVTATHPFATTKTVDDSTTTVVDAVGSVSGGGLTGAEHAWLEDTDTDVDVLIESQAVICPTNPLFYLTYDSDGNINETRAVQEAVGAIDPSSRESGESTVDWLNRVCPTMSWTLGVSGSTQYSDLFVYGVYPSDATFVAAVWPWDVYALAVPAATPHWYYTPSSGGPPRDVMEDIIFFLSISTSRPS